MNTITGTAGNDKLIVTSGDLAVFGLAGDDDIEINLDRGYSNVFIDGGAGRDALTVPVLAYSDARTKTLWVNLATGEVRVEGADGLLEIRSITLRGIESLYAGKGWSGTLIGDDNDNNLSFVDASGRMTGVLIAGKGNDTLVGGTADYSVTLGPVVASLAARTASSVDGNDTLNVRNLVGSAFGDVLTGDGYGNSIEGGLGNDTLSGAGDGARRSGTSYPDVAVYSHANGPVFVNLATGRATGADGNDELLGFEGVFGSAFDDVLDGSGVADPLFLVGGAGNDTLKGGSEYTTLVGGAGDDLLTAPPGAYATADYAEAGAAIQVNLLTGDVQGASSGHDTLVNVHGVMGTRFADAFVGSALNDTIKGGGGADTVMGGDGDDVLSDGALIDGGNGNDLLSAADTFADFRLVTLQGGAGNDTLRGGAVELGGPGDDEFILGRAGVQSVDGGDGFDVIRLPSSDSGYSTRILLNLATGELRIGNPPYESLQTVDFRSIEGLYESKGWSATFIGNSADNVLRGTVVVGGGGNDTLSGRAADYSATLGPVNASLTTHVAQSVDGTDSISVLDLVGSAFNDVLVGDSARNIFEPGLGDDTVDGGADNDTITYAHAPGAVSVSLATGSSAGAAGKDTLANFENLFGSAFDDALEGNQLANVLMGDSGNDTLNGGAGNDTLTGGDGADRLLGGAGNDLFLDFDSGDTLDGGDGIDALWLPAFSTKYSNDDWVVNLSANTITYSGRVLNVSLRSIESVDASRFEHATLIGNDDANVLNGFMVMAGGGDDTILWSSRNYDSRYQVRHLDGGAGVDQFRVPYPRQDWVLQRDQTLQNVYRLGDTHDPERARITDVERFVFSDQVLAVGTRATEVAKIMFPLWSPAILGLTQCMGKGVDWYDHGHSFDEGIRYALSFFADKSDAQLAAQLATNVPLSAGGYSAETLLALMASHSGGVGNIDGRAYATTLMANDAANLATITAIGLPSYGFECARVWGAEPLFVFDPGTIWGAESVYAEGG